MGKADHQAERGAGNVTETKLYLFRDWSAIKNDADKPVPQYLVNPRNIDYIEFEPNSEHATIHFNGETKPIRVDFTDFDLKSIMFSEKFDFGREWN